MENCVGQGGWSLNVYLENSPILVGTFLLRLEPGINTY